MKYQLIANNGRIVAEAKRVNDSFLVQEVRGCLFGGFFDDETVKLFCDDSEIEPQLITDKDDKRNDDWFDRKNKTHKLISVIDGVSGFKRKNIWVKR